MSISNNGSNGSNSNKGASMKINDLSFYSATLQFGNSSMDNIVKDGELFAEFGSDLSTDAVEYLISQEEKKENRDVIGAKALLKTNGVSFDDSMDDEVIMLLAEQYMDDVTNVYGYAQNKSEGVLVIVQQLSNSGNWYTVKNKEGVKCTYWYDVDTLFERSNGAISGFKTKSALVNKIDMESRKVVKVQSQLPVIVADMQALGHMVDGHIGRVLLKSSAFVRGTVIETHIIEEVPAQFNYGYRNDEVVDEATNYVWDNITEVFAGVAILPSDSDTTQGKADQMAHDDNILVGSSIVTNAMSAEYMDAQERNAQIALEAELEVIAIRARLPIAIKKERNETLIKSGAGEVAQFIIELSYIDCESALTVANKEIDRLPEILKAMYAIKTQTGNGCNYAVYKKLQALVVKPEDTKKAIKEVEMHVLENIAMLNNGEISISDLTDEEAVEILDTAIANAKLIPAAKIELNVYRPLADRVKAIKYGNKVQEAKALFPKVVA